MEHPEYLLGLMALPILLFAGWQYWNWYRHRVNLINNKSQFSQLSPKLFWLKTSLICISIALIIIGLANPQGKTTTIIQEGKSADLVIAIDISNSMLAEDIRPSRLKATINFAQKLVKNLAGERIGLVFFAGTAYLQAPIATDYDFLLRSLENASPDLISAQGTDIGTAIQVAKESMEASIGGGRAVILISDGENHGNDAFEAVESAKKAGIYTYTVSVGSSQGSLIPSPDQGDNTFKRDEFGELVRSRPDESGLAKMAQIGNGKAFYLRDGDDVTNGLVAEIEKLEKIKHEIKTASSTGTWFRWLILPALILVFTDTLIRPVAATTKPSQHP